MYIVRPFIFTSPHRIWKCGIMLIPRGNIFTCGHVDIFYLSLFLPYGRGVMFYSREGEVRVVVLAQYE